MLGSAPTDRTQSVRGIEALRIRLGIVQPGESIAIFNDALSTLAASLAYLYSSSSGDRFWYDTRPTLRKTVEDRATQISASDVDYEIEQRLRKLPEEYKKERRNLSKSDSFLGFHVCPGSSLDVTDEQYVRLVILRPADEYRASSKDCAAMTSITDILNSRGNTPRIYRNMLAFVAPDHNMMQALKQGVRLFLAWKSIKDDKDDLNLDAAQNREADENLRRCDETVDARIKEAYCWLLVPYIDKNEDLKTIIWDSIKISGGNESIILKAEKKMLQNEAVITAWAPALLKMELDNLLWREADSIAIKKLWEYLSTYCYLPRLANENVLNEAIRTGVDRAEYFAYCSGIDGLRYVDLKFNQSIDMVERSGYLVKTDAAKKQLEEEEAKRRAEANAKTGSESDGYAATSNVGELLTVNNAPPEIIQKNKRFFMSAEIDTTRINRDVQKLVEEIIQHLTSVDGAQVKVSMEVEAVSADGFSQQTVRTVSENCRTMRIKESGFEG